MCTVGFKASYAGQSLKADIVSRPMRVPIASAAVRAEWQSDCRGRRSGCAAFRAVLVAGSARGLEPAQFSLKPAIIFDNF